MKGWLYNTEVDYLVTCPQVFLLLSIYCGDRMAQADLRKDEKEMKFWQERGERYLSQYRERTKRGPIEIVGNIISEEAVKELDRDIMSGLTESDLTYDTIFKLAEQVWNHIYCSATQEEIDSKQKEPNRRPWAAIGKARNDWMEVFTTYERFRFAIKGDAAPEKTDHNIGTWYKSSVSGLWYSNPNAAGDINEVRVNGKSFIPDDKDEEDGVLQAMGTLLDKHPFPNPLNQ